MLAQKMCDGGEGGFPTVPAEYLKWSHRFRLIKEHIREVNADIIGLVELDSKIRTHFLSDELNEQGKQALQDMLDFLTEEGYKGHTHDKMNGACGLGIFYKADKFDLVDSKVV